jgi:hypothetical protein
MDQVEPISVGEEVEVDGSDAGPDVLEIAQASESSSSKGKEKDRGQARVKTKSKAAEKAEEKQKKSAVHKLHIETYPLRSRPSGSKVSKVWSLGFTRYPPKANLSDRAVCEVCVAAQNWESAEFAQSRTGGTSNIVSHLSTHHRKDGVYEVLAAALFSAVVFVRMK